MNWIIFGTNNIEGNPMKQAEGVFVFFIYKFDIYSFCLCGLFRQVIIRARNLRANANFIPAKAFRARKVYYTNEVS